jgi:flavin reductase (DIM6/NTAB) family NADH-FMN oxidoreductase RutF
LPDVKQNGFPRIGEIAKMPGSSIESLFKSLERELWLVSAHDGAPGGGLIATWVSQASIDREAPTVAIAMAANHFTRELIDAGKCSFGLHLLKPEQIELVWRFALASGRDVDKLAGLVWQAGQQGAPLLNDCFAALDCRIYDRHDGGDRIYYWADVVACTLDEKACQEGIRPLTDHQMIALASDEQKATLKASLLADAEIQRPLLAAHRQRL